MKAQYKTYQKLISVLVVMLILGPAVLLSKPQQAHAQPALGGPSWLVDLFTGGTAGSGAATAGTQATSLGIQIKNVAHEVLKQIVMSVEKRLLQQMTKSTVNWINSGFHGSPLFVQNPGSFFKDIAKTEIKTLVDQFGYDPRKFPFGKQFALNTINSYKAQLADNAQYTLSTVINDPTLLDRYRNNWNTGGWNGFLINNLYPQNNYLGFQMMATEQLGRQLAGTTQNAAQKVQTTLQQGMGFLSPQTCPSNKNYPIATNPYNKPSFTSTEPVPQMEEPEAPIIPDPGAPIYQGDEQQYEIDSAQYQADYENYVQEKSQYDDAWTQYGEQTAIERQQWDQKYGCPGGLVDSTPGTVVANQITTALGSTFRTTELGTAVGGSISAVVDALLNHFLDKGLNALASTVNPKPQKDTWNYNGQTLGGPSNSNTNDVFSGPDIVVVLDDFKKQIQGETDKTAKAGDKLPDGTTAQGGEIISQVGDTSGTSGGTYMPGDIANTQAELALMDNPNASTVTTDAKGQISNNPGITQMISVIWPKIRELDICIPGPDLGWKDRMLDELQRNSQKLEEKSSDSNPDKAAIAAQVLNELKFAVNSFQDWIDNKMLTALPDSVNYMDAVDQIKDLQQRSDELTAAKRAKVQALARLQSIKTGLDTFDTQPAAGSGREKTLLTLKKQYDAITAGISNTSSVENTRSQLATVEDQFVKLANPIDGMIKQCKDERVATQCNTQGFVAGKDVKKYWQANGGANSLCNAKNADGTVMSGKDPIFNGGSVDGVEFNSEQGQFCSAPVYHGYNHESFDHVNDNPGGHGLLGTIGGIALGGPVGGIIGNKIGGAIGGPGESDSVAYPDLPYVNAKDVLAYRNKLVSVLTLGLGGHRQVDIQMDCTRIFKSTVLDYKGNLPGLTTVTETNSGLYTDTSGSGSGGTDTSGGPNTTNTSPPPPNPGNNSNTANPPSSALFAAPTSLNFAAAAGTNPIFQQVIIRNEEAAGNTIRWNAVVNQAASFWLEVSPTGQNDLAGGATGVQLNVLVSSTSLARGQYNGTITISAVDLNTGQATNTINIPVSLLIY